MERTTVRLSPPLLREAKREAARRGETLTALIEEGLRDVIAKSRKPHHRKRVKLPVSRMGGGTLPGVNLENSAELLDIMEGLR